MSDFDIIVIGGGPPGCYAALTAATVVLYRLGPFKVFEFAQACFKRLKEAGEQL